MKASFQEAPLRLEDLTDELIQLIVAILRPQERGRVCSTCRRLRLLTLDPSVWATIEMRPSSVREDLALRRIGSYTTELRVRNPWHSRHSHKFCKWHLLGPNPHIHESACGGLLDAGAAVLLGRCPSLQELHMPGMGHLTRRTLQTVLDNCRELRVLNLRGCERILSGFAAASEADDAPPPFELPQLVELDLSHVRITDDDLIVLLERLPSLATLKVNFCSELSDDVLDALPSTIAHVEALGCERLSWRRMEQLRHDLGTDEQGGERVRCDDSAVLAVGRDVESLFSMLTSYRMEEARWE
jgi:hypothetical protein